VKSIEIISPVFNEQECLSEFMDQCLAIFALLPEYQWTLTLVENGSTDMSWEIMNEKALNNPQIKMIKLSRNFGMDGGLTAGVSQSKADAVILMASDLQDPPSAIPSFVALWEKGYDNVYGVVTKRGGVPLIRRMNSQIFYFVANRLTGNLIPRNVSDFRLLSKRMYTALDSMKEANRVVRGMIAWLGFKSVGIDVERAPRFGGESKAHSWRVIGIGVRAILANSYLPLRLISFLGFFVSMGSILSLIFTSVLFLFYGVPFPGFGTIVSLILLLFGILFLILGILSEYIGMIYEEVKMRPNFVIEEIRGSKKL
jgi:polyisoprenyl-phosphate glycosyltransferase